MQIRANVLIEVMPSGTNKIFLSIYYCLKIANQNIVFWPFLIPPELEMTLIIDMSRAKSRGNFILVRQKMSLKSKCLNLGDEYVCF